MLTPKSGPLGRRLAAHLLRRASYNVSKARIDEFANYTVQEAMDVLMTPIEPEYREPRWVQECTTVPNIYPQCGSVPNVGDESINCGTTPPNCTHYGNLGSHGTTQTHLWWFLEAFQDTSMRHKLQYFLSTCLMPNIDAGVRYGFDGLALLQQYAFGSYRLLARKMAMSLPMMELLDVNTSTADNPNENFPREFMELYTIGKGEQIAPGDYTSYTEHDVQEAAKIFTGFRYLHNGGYLQNIDPDTNLNSGTAWYHEHDTSDKTFSTAFNEQTIIGAADAADMFRELDDFVDMLFEQEHTAIYLCRRMYRFFVADELTPDIETNIILPLAETFRNSDYNIETVMRELLSSQHFYEEDAWSVGKIIAGQIADSISLATMHLSRFEYQVPDLNNVPNGYWVFHISPIFLGANNLQSFFNPPTVAGFLANFQAPLWSCHWFSSETIAARLDLPVTPRFLNQIDLATWVSNNVSNPFEPATVVLEIVEVFFPETPPQERLDYFLDEYFLRFMTESDWAQEWSSYEVTGDDTEVKLVLRDFVDDVLKAIEVQVM